LIIANPTMERGGWVRGLGSGIRFGVWGMGFGVWGLGVEVRGSGIGAWGSGLQTPAGTPDAIWGSWRCLEARATPGGLQTPSGVLGVSGGTSPLGPRASRPHLGVSRGVEVSGGPVRPLRAFRRHLGYPEVSGGPVLPLRASRPHLKCPEVSGAPNPKPGPGGDPESFQTRPKVWSKGVRNGGHAALSFLVNGDCFVPSSPTHDPNYRHGWHARGAVPREPAPAPRDREAYLLRCLRRVDILE
jgi:hypothetical protein